MSCRSPLSPRPPSLRPRALRGDTENTEWRPGTAPAHTGGTTISTLNRKGTVMNRLHRISRALGALGTLAGVLVLTLAGSPAHARPVPPDGVREFVSAPPPVTRIVVT